MNAVADTGALYVLYDADDQDHQRISEALDTVRGSICVPTAVLGEIDYLLREWLGVDAELAFLASLKNRAFQLEQFAEAETPRNLSGLEHRPDRAQRWSPRLSDWAFRRC